MTFYFVAGEASGDARAAELMRAIAARRPGVEFAGLGGPQMRAVAGDRVEDWIAAAGVIGFLDVIRRYPYFRARLGQAVREVAAAAPTALVLVDYPGFNLRLAAAVRRAAGGAAQRIIYYISPQVWAWNEGRIPRLARLLDLMLCLFPFEKPLYERSGLRAEFVGHPLREALAGPAGPAGPAPARHRDDRLVALFPGSREREVKKIFPVMLAAAAALARRQPALRFAAAAASADLAALMRRLARRTPEIACEITAGQARELMARAAVGLVASGTATLEAALLGLPHVILYKVAWLTWLVGRHLVRVPFLGIVNILAGREVVPELLQDRARPMAVATAALALLEKPAERRAQLAGVAATVESLGPPGAADRAAAALLAACDGAPERPGGPAPRGP